MSLANAHANLDNVADLWVPATIETLTALVIGLTFPGFIAVAHALVARDDCLVFLLGVIIDQ